MRRTIVLLCAIAMTLAFQFHALADLQPGRGELLSGTSRPVARFYPEYFTEDDAVASFAMKRAWARGADLPDRFPVRPRFQRLADGRHMARIDIEPGTSLYGTGEVGGPLLRNGRTVTLWNTDAYGYGADTVSLYKSHPYVLAVRPDGTAFGVIADSTWRMDIDLDGAITFIAEGKPFPLYVWDRVGPMDVTRTLAELTGTMPLPPLWALGYHQCRYSYYPEARVREVAGEFRTRNMPGTVFWFDIDYMDEYRTFTFDRSKFPDPKRLNSDLGEQGWKRIWMINPGVKDEPGFFVRDAMVNAGYAVTTEKGELYRGAVWPGLCVFPDFTRPDVRAWWATLYKDFMAQGVDGVWNDMNEPAIFNVASKTMPESNRHAGGEYRPYLDAPPVVVTPGDHARFHNVYGMLMSQASYEGILAANPEKRPFVLTRSGFLGSHRYVASWTGDNTADWAHLEMSIPMALNLALSGWSFTGPDIGGFISNGPNSFEGERAMHFARWMGIGAMLPFARGHTGKGNINKEPWEFGPDTERASRIALTRRYRLLPYLYTLFEECSRDGTPVVRPTFFADPKDPALRSEDDTFLLGDILVVPQLMPDRSRVPVMPGGIWRRFDIVNESHPDLPDLYLRGGAIVPVGPEQEWVGQKPLSPLTLIASLDERGEAAGVLYEDAGDGFGYREGQFRRVHYRARQIGNAVHVWIERTEGNLPRPARELQVLILRDGAPLQSFGAFDGERVIIGLPGAGT